MPMANSTTAYYESITAVDELEKTVMKSAEDVDELEKTIVRLQEKIVTLETTITALTQLIKTNDDIGKIKTQNAELIGILNDVNSKLKPLGGWLHRNKWV